MEIEGINAAIDILPATNRFNLLENEINQLIDRNAYFKNEILPKINGYDYLIIDTPPALNILNINAFCVSDHVHIVMNADYFSISAITEMKEILEQIRGINPKIKYGLVLNAYFKNRVLTENMMELLHNEPTFSGIEIPHRQHVQNSITLKKPAIEHPDIQKPFAQLAAIV